MPGRSRLGSHRKSGRRKSSDCGLDHQHGSPLNASDDDWSTTDSLAPNWPGVTPSAATAPGFQASTRSTFRSPKTRPPNGPSASCCPRVSKMAGRTSHLSPSASAIRHAAHGRSTSAPTRLSTGGSRTRNGHGHRRRAVLRGLDRQVSVSGGRKNGAAWRGEGVWRPLGGSLMEASGPDPSPRPPTDQPDPRHSRSGSVLTRPKSRPAHP
jgi:hypothetical protein